MRQSGILMHITSLPGPYGVGTMGAPAREFVDFLQSAGQSKWQILPLTPTGFGDSPYQSCSAFAGNPYLIDLQELIDEGLLEKAEAERIRWSESDTRVDFGVLYEKRHSVLYKAYTRFQDQASLTEFCQKNSDWLPDFALFMALKECNGAKPWYEWEDGLKNRDPDTLYQGNMFYYTCIGEKDELQPVYDLFSNDSRFRCTLQQELYRPEYWCEIMPAKVSKANAIRKLKEMWGCSRVISFGDAINDIPMFEISDECYAVENAVDELKAVATGVIESNEEDGVAKWLLEYAEF